MTVAKIYSVHAVQGANVIRGLMTINESDGLNNIIMAGASEVDPTLRATISQIPTLTIETLDVKTVLDFMFSGNTVPHLAFSSAYDVYLQEMTDAGTRTGNGIKLSIAKGVIIPVSIRGEPAVLTFQILPVYGGSVAPIVKTTGDALAVAAPGTTAHYKCAALKDNATVLSQISDFTLNFGVTAVPQKPANSIWPTDYIVDGFNPTADFGAADLATMLGLTGLAGASPGSAGLIFYILKYDPAGIGAVASSALTLTFRTQSCYYCTSIPHGEGFAIARFSVIGIGTAAAAPVAYATGVATPTETSSPASFSAGPAKHNTTLVPLVSGSFSFNHDVRVNKDPADLWPTEWYIMKRLPTINAQVFSGDFYQSLGGYGIIIDTGFHIYWRKHAANSVPKSDATAEHIKITINAGWISPTGSNSSHDGQSSFGAKVESVKGGSAAATVSTASAIT
jgi:hypothetical protein